MDTLGCCAAVLCGDPQLPRRSPGGGHGHFGEGLAETLAGTFESNAVPDRLLLADDGESGPSKGQVGALAIAIGRKLAPPTRGDSLRVVCLLLHRRGSCSGESRADAGQLLAEVGARVRVAGDGCGAVTSVLERLAVQQGCHLPLEGVTGIFLAFAGTAEDSCPVPGFQEREVMVQMLDPAVHVHCTWLSSVPGPRGRLQLWSST
ncbi:unnamed protein product, partial [Polarella glacialis]